MGTFLTAIKKINARTGIATVVAATLPITIMGAALHFYISGTISLTFAPPLIVGAVLGGFAGTSIIVRAPHLSLRFLHKSHECAENDCKKTHTGGVDRFETISIYKHKHYHDSASYSRNISENADCEPDGEYREKKK